MVLFLTQTVGLAHAGMFWADLVPLARGGECILPGPGFNFGAAMMDDDIRVVHGLSVLVVFIVG